MICDGMMTVMEEGSGLVKSELETESEESSRLLRTFVSCYYLWPWGPRCNLGLYKLGFSYCLLQVLVI